MVLGKKGGLAIESLTLLVTVLFTSAAVFYLVQSGIVSVEGSSGAAASQDQFLNVQFLPIEKGGTLAIQEFSLCYDEDIDYDNLLCTDDRELFFPGDEVHFTYEVISSSYLGTISLTENYRLLGPNDEIILDVAAVNDIEYEAEADEEVELVKFRDYFVLGDDEPAGEYKLELIITNTLIEKEAVLRKEITVLAALE
ncbi:hypothetical protein CL619_00010 [archaeon]|nr:hypothetical protein [archaeon]|tara:strand:+ start:627 stop:1217 length:591 start_codon:yes stop_codon:yes gene_type:complete